MRKAPDGAAGEDGFDGGLLHGHAAGDGGGGAFDGAASGAALVVFAAAAGGAQVVPGLVDAFGEHAEFGAAVAVGVQPVDQPAMVFLELRGVGGGRHAEDAVAVGVFGEEGLLQEQHRGFAQRFGIELGGRVRIGGGAFVAGGNADDVEHVGRQGALADAGAQRRHPVEAQHQLDGFGHLVPWCCAPLGGALLSLPPLAGKLPRPSAWRCARRAHPSAFGTFPRFAGEGKQIRLPVCP